MTASHAHFPPLGLGVWEQHGADLERLVRRAVDLGYPLIDTASAYGNEGDVGRALGDAGTEGDDVLVTTKVWLTDYGDVPDAVDRSRRLLGRDRLDLVLLHWPVPSRFDRTLAAWASLVELRERGRVERIGVSNFSPSQLDVLTAHTGVVPEVNQIELHPFFAQDAAHRAHAARGIVTQAYSPLGGPVRGRQRPVDAHEIASIAAEVSATPAQVILAWHRHRGIAAVPRTSSPARLAENLGSLGVELGPRELELIARLDTGTRLSADPDLVDEHTFS